ncbi:hypothetical protein GH733_014453, partial [Mirounga leonina]
MDEQVTLKKIDGGTDIMLVVPKATVLQLHDSQQERNHLMQVKLQLEGQVTEREARFRSPRGPGNHQAGAGRADRAVQ